MLNTLPSVIHSILFSPTFSQHFQTHLLRLINNSQRTENIPLPPNSKRHPFQNPCSSNSKLYLYPPLPPFIKQIIPREASRTGGNPSEPRRIPLPGVKLKRVNGGARSGWKRDGTKTMPGRNTRGERRIGRQVAGALLSLRAPVLERTRLQLRVLPSA